MVFATLAGERPARPRLAVVDLVRGVAIVAMVVYHTAFDLSADALIGIDISADLRWRLFARLVAGTFLALVGVSLVLATRNGLDRGGYFRRLALIAGGAALVTIGTWWFDSSTFVFFGILHEIVVASLLALPFLALPSWLVAIVAAAVLAAPWFLASPIFNQPTLWWVGLSSEPPVTIDYVPVLPWFGVVLAGIVLGRLLVAHGGALAAWRPRDMVSRTLIRAGRWSLAIYLIHQPLIVGVLYLVALWVPPGEAVMRERFAGECTPACVDSGRDAGDCVALCGCMFENLYGTDLFAVRSTSDMTPDQRARWDGIIDVCRTPPPPAD